MSLERCHTESRQVGTKTNWTWDNFGNYNVTFQTEAEARAYTQSKFDAAIRSPQGYIYVGRGGTVGAGIQGKPIPYYQYGAANPNNGDVDENGCIISCGSSGGCVHVCGYVRNFEEFFRVKVFTTTVPVYESFNVCEQLSEPQYVIYITSYSDAAGTDKLTVTMTELHELINQTSIELAGLKARYESDPSSGRLKSIQLTEMRLEDMMQEMTRIHTGVGDALSIDEILMRRAPLIGTPVTQIIATPEGNKLIEFDSNDQVVDVRTPTPQDYLNLIPPKVGEGLNIVHILLGIAAGIAGGYAVNEIIKRFRKK